MKDIIPRVDRELLKKELTKKNYLRPTNKADNEIYDFLAADAPNLMREVARLRELSYRTSGGSTGEELDMDSMDTMTPHSYHQLIVWDPINEEIVGGYRYMLGKECAFDEAGQPILASSHMFHYTQYFIQDYLPYTIELGRAFVQPMYQKRDMGVKSLYALDNIWDGIGAVLYIHRKDIQYLIGKVTTYPQYDAISRDLIFAYLHRYHFDTKGLFYPKQPLEISAEGQELADDIFVGDDITLNYQLLQRAIRARGSVVPAMFSAYLNVTSSLQYFGTAINDEMGNVIETGIMVTVSEIHEDKRNRYIGVYIDYLKKLFSNRKINKISLLTEES